MMASKEDIVTICRKIIGPMNRHKMAVLSVFMGQPVGPWQRCNGLQKNIFSLAMVLAVYYNIISLSAADPSSLVDPAGGFQVFWATGPEEVSNVYW